MAFDSVSFIWFISAPRRKRMFNLSDLSTAVAALLPSLGHNVLAARVYRKQDECLVLLS